jgi:hypothetical protein
MGHREAYFLTGGDPYLMLLENFNNDSWNLKK